ncbi:GNAT family N-acetyltransferase [Enterovirga aerilata]|uniref:Acetyltransferase n=1 Tax=Enterovirga aerilata TaxID=2730920 RepID=A0A849IAP2_9HYPH|nr:acetyltransferase [Enterovirga sp. DB1703]
MRLEAPAYAFRPVAAADLPLLARWLAEPHVAEWWHGDGLAEIRAAIADPSTEPFLVEFGGEPIGYIQHYAPHLEDGHPYRDQPDGTLGIDQFIGPPDLVGRGHGSCFVTAFVEELFRRGAPRVVTDPDPSNPRAIRAYEKAGFVRLGFRDTIFGRVLLMARDARKDDRAKPLYRGLSHRNGSIERSWPDATAPETGRSSYKQA